MTKPVPRSWLVGLALASLFLLFSIAIASPAKAQGQQPGFGGIVGDLGADAEHVLSTSGAPTQVSYRDSDGDGSLDGGEAVYLARSSTTQAGDVRLADPVAGTAFTKVSSEDDDVGLSLSTLSGTLRYFDANHDGSLSAGDTVYYDRDAGQTQKVDNNDVILAGTDAGDKVTSSHPNVGIGLTDTSANPSFGYFDTNDDGTYDSNESAIVDIDSDGWVTVGDVRLVSTDGGAGGTIAEAGDDDVTYILEDFDETWEFRHRDPDGDGNFDVNEPAYISKGDSVSTFAVRIGNPPSGHEAGSQVIEQDDDWGIDTKRISGSLSYLETNADGSFDANDRLYYDLSDGNGGEVSTGDIVLSGANAGELVSGGAKDVGSSLDSYSGSLLYFDQDGNGNYGADIVYADTDNDDIVKSYDVQLSDAKDPYASDDGTDDGTDGGSDDTETDPATVAITSPANGTEVVVGETINLTGTADGGGPEGKIDRIDVAVRGGQHDLEDVSGKANWTTAFTPREAVTYNVTATVHPASGDNVSTSITLEAVESRDTDGDQVADREDNCPEAANPEQTDTDGDGAGDACDDDVDDDGIANGVDQCPEEAGAPEEEGCPAPLDSDEDGIANDEDECPEVSGTEANQGCPEDQGTDNETGGNDTGGQEGVPGPGAVLTLVVAGIVAVARRRQAR